MPGKTAPPPAIAAAGIEEDSRRPIDREPPSATPTLAWHAPESCRPILHSLRGCQPRLIFFALTLASMLVAPLHLKDSRVVLSLATTILWLLIATTAATFQALWNHNEFYGVGPFMEPKRALLKDAR